MRYNKAQAGFTLIELIAVLIIAGIVAAVVLSRSLPSSTLQLQAARDSLLLTLLNAQQQALATARPVQFSVRNSHLDLRQDFNGDGSFSPDESIRSGGQQYPVAISGITFQSRPVQFGSDGFSTGGEILLGKSDAKLVVRVSEGGYAY